MNTQLKDHAQLALDALKKFKRSAGAAFPRKTWGKPETNGQRLVRLSPHWERLAVMERRMEELKEEVIRK